MGHPCCCMEKFLLQNLWQHYYVVNFANAHDLNNYEKKAFSVPSLYAKVDYVIFKAQFSPR